MRSLILVLTIFIIIPIYGQLYEPYKVSYGTDAGLPSSECYAIIQDSKGYIWFGTDRGVVKYNGYEFVTYTTKDGLNNNVVFYLQEDEKGRIWFYDKTHQLSYFQNDSIYSYKYNAVLKKNIKATEATPLGFYVTNNRVYPSLSKQYRQQKDIFYINENGEAINQENDNCDHVFTRVNNRFVTNFNGLKLNRVEDSTEVITVCIKDSNYTLSGDFVFNKNLYSPSVYRSIIINKESYFNFGNKLYKLKKNGEIEIVFTFNKGIIELQTDEDGNIYVGLFDEGLWLIPKGNIKKKYKIVSDCSVSSFCKDNSEGIWLSTLEKGVIYLPSLAFNIYKPSKNIFVNHINGNASSIIYSSKVGNIYSLIDNQLIPLKLDNPYYVRNIKPIKGDTYLIPLGSSFSYYYISVKEKPELVSDISSLDWYENDTAIFGSEKGALFQLIKSNLTKPIFLDTCEAINTSISVSFDDNILLGSSNGVYQYDGKNISKAFVNDSIYSSRITDIELFKDSILFTSTRGNGLIIHQKDSIPYSLTKSDGLISNELDKIYIKNHHVFALSKEGVSMINYFGNDFTITNFTNKNALLSNEVNGVYERDDTVWIATNRGISQINLAKAQIVTTNIPVYLKNVNINGSAVDFSNLIELKYFENEVEFNYEAISFHHKGLLNYRYKLIGIDKSWNYTTSRSIRYPRLSPGNYEFIISIEETQGKWSKKYSLAKIEIDKPFWEEVWFIAIIVLLIGMLIWFAIKSYIKKVKKETEIKQTIMDLERRAVQAQMNPHFIFNALTSIQSLIVQNKNDKAQQFLVTFSRLVRTALNHSSLTYVPLSQELELIKNYLKIENLRFTDLFEYEIIIEDSIRQDEIEIPPMIIQPFLENAIEHGLLKKETQGFLSLHIKEVNEFILECIIEDNGIGRMKSGIVPKRKGRESKGINLVKDRLLIINKNSKVEIIDLMDKGESLGTRVKLHIPYKRNS